MRDRLEVYRASVLTRAELANLDEVRTSTVAEDKRALEAGEAPANEAPSTPSPPDHARIDQLIGERDHWCVDALTDQLFYERHPDAKGQKLMPGTAEAAEWSAIKRELVEPRVQAAIEKKAAGVTTRWSENLYSDARDNEAADALFYERHPELQGKALKPGSAAAKEWLQLHREVVQNKHNDAITEGIKEFPGLDPKVLKSLLVTESRFVPDVVNRYGYAGIAQFGKRAARSVGMNVDGGVDDRLDPKKAIPGAAKHLLEKATYLKSETFSKYGTPKGDEYWKFVLAAYNGGEGPVSAAMADAYRVGLAEAKDRGLGGAAAIEYAENYAGTWENLRRPEDDFTKSPLYKATHRYYPNIAEEKYHEIGRYPVSIMNRAGR